MSASAVRASVEGYKGMVTWAYSQSDWSTVKIIIQNKDSMFGICKSLSAQWCVDHAYGGALYNRVVGADGNINSTAIRKIRDDFVSLWRNQQERTEEWMRLRGLLRRGKSSRIEFDRPRRGQNFQALSSARGDMGGASNKATKDDPDIASKIANYLNTIHVREKKVRMGGSYCMISFGGAGMGHAVCAWVAQDAVFFDPNCGEYFFENAADFVRWFPHYYRLYGYTGWPMKFLKRWSVEEYALAARGMGHLAAPRPS